MTFRPLRPGVGVAVAVASRGRVLAVLRRNPPARGIWALPGGRIELGETLVEAGKREVLEETGLSISVNGLIDVRERIEHDAAGEVTEHWIIVVVSGRLSAKRGDFPSADAGTVSPDPEPLAGDDAVEARWLTPAELAELPAVDGLVQLAERALRAH